MGVVKLDWRLTVTGAVRKSGRKLYIEMTFALVTVDGAARGAVALARDVTEQVLQQKAARANASGSE